MRRAVACGLLAATLVIGVSPARAQAPRLVGLGDSLGEGVQSAEASLRTQRASYINLIAAQMGAEMPLPLIATWPFGQVGEMLGRRRIDPSVEGRNLSVSGARVRDLLHARADASRPEQIDSETDLVLFPRSASQIEIVEALRPELVVCWIGSNDVLAAATSFDALDASQMTSVESFSASYRELASRLEATGAKVVLGNIPDVTSIGFVMDGADLMRFVGDDFALPAGSYTTLPTMLLLRLGLAGESLLQDPSYVLDAGEIARIEERTEIFNRIIDEEAARIGAPVVNMHDWLRLVASRPIRVLGIELTGDYLGGIYSLDGVHPSRFGHVLVARLFLTRMNSYFGTRFPLPTFASIGRALRKDPFTDKDGDLRARGIPLNGALETFGPLLGISGDFDELRAGPRAGRDPARGRELLRAIYGRARPASSFDDRDAVEAMRSLFGLARFSGPR